MLPPLLALVLIVPALPALAAADVITLSPVRDNTLFEDAQGDTSNGSGAGIFCGRISQGRARRALIAFDVTGALPQEAVLDSVRVELHMEPSSDLSERVVSLHRVLADWGEGASASAGGSGAPAQPGDATWLHTFYPASYWSVPGGDFVATPSASATVLGEGDYGWRSETLTDDVRGWLSQGMGSFGWGLIGDESAPNTARRFDSREGTTLAYRPRLVIYYSRSTPARSSSWGRLKAHYR